MQGEVSGFFKAIIEFNREEIKGTFIERNLKTLKKSIKAKEEVTTLKYGKPVIRVIDDQEN